MSTRVTDAELVEAFLGQADRCTHSGQMLGDCFSASQFDLAFQYGSVAQRSAIRHALIACLSLPAPDPCADLPVRYATFEKHLENLLLHTLKSVAGDMQVARPERVAANLLVEAAWFRNNFEVAARSPPGRCQCDQRRPTRPLAEGCAAVWRRVDSGGRGPDAQ